MLAFDLVGGWTSPNLLLRFLTLGDTKWEPLRAGFTHRVTRERVTLGMGPPSPSLAMAFAPGLDRFRPTIDADLLDEILTHRAVVTVSNPVGTGLERVTTLVRAANAVVDAGALAVRCRTSGLAHGADGFQALAVDVEAAVGRPHDLVEALFGLYVHTHLDPRPSTLGMSVFDAPDVEIDGTGDLDRDLPRLRAAALDVLRGGPVSLRPDVRGLGATLTNPHGLTTPPGA